MIFKNSMSFKAKIKQIAIEKGIATQQVQQNYLIEAFLTKLANSDYKNNFIVKGGYLIGEIVQAQTNESFEFVVNGAEDIRETEDYPGLKLKLIASFERIQEVVTIDVTTGDIITPKEMEFSFKKIFEDESLELLSYTIETVLAEKVETI
ncbi:nucleotidyl transferase AbiEii/AbiGii toxin family protein [Lachnospiraceae bacterium OttesenSCG-928-J05]|nr:nucleotidyl transferase AbiEii/AbiGii toxin family protein [Lachnospiraceae bacterium OttesenSCG-928-J05]